jgi:hypothetical protein
MQLEVTKDDIRERLWVDRDSFRNDYGTEGMDITINHLTLHFEDEEDAVTMAELILCRLGKSYTPPASGPCLPGLPTEHRTVVLEKLQGTDAPGAKALQAAVQEIAATARPSPVQQTPSLPPPKEAPNS